MNDYREIARDMGIFASDELVGAGLPLWLPAGAIVRRELEQLGRDIAAAGDCAEVYSPVLAKRALFERSGHWAKFTDDMFPPMDLGDDLVLRPANCPHHARIYAAQQHSYRDLPVRLHELAPMFRAERSGVLSGLTRVRQISLDDTHVFCRPDQVAQEVTAGVAAILHAVRVLRLRIDHIRLSRRDDSPAYLGAPEQWAAAEHALREAAAQAGLDRLGIPLVEAEGEAAFYGPKLDVQVLDARGHEESLATVQLDFHQPEAFDLSYQGEDGRPHRVMMIHRGTIGSMERMVAFLLEQYDGRLPLWLAPVQVCLLPIAPAHQPYADVVADALRRNGIRVQVVNEESLGARIRDSRRRRDALIVVVGDAEVERDMVQVNDPASGERCTVPAAQLATAVAQAVRHRAPLQWPDHVVPEAN
ncbi:threonine--tRNA ligase [Calidifontibacter sp. DB0510]|uniref:Threonine--tRNA ligase n=1 Tax=Metallococcus carri TaxID=1656884 RepID=A0A967AZX3_9MICO|nr:threonine--tRNA ligase [Metallococcus carri]NOP37198.1 threonine--tRNA ligase [Calidifontibacter sp. DB2511S]